MKRLHVHVSVEDLDSSVGFYETLFGAAPDVVKADYAKWQLDDPRVNFAISTGCGQSGVDHLGIQVDNGDDLVAITEALTAAEAAVAVQPDAQCCYARGDKTWVNDPQGVKWETFHTKGAITTFGKDLAPESANARN